MGQGVGGRLIAIDVLRGFAALYVVLFHAAAVPSPRLAVPELLAPLVNFGGTGVLLFFVLSGFSLSMTMPRHMAARRPLLSYAQSRFWRIAPVFYVLLIAGVIQEYVVEGAPLWPGRIALNASFLFNLVPGQQQGIVLASWTIGVEMIYYAVFPLLYRLSPGWKLAVGALCGAAFWGMRQSPALYPMSYFCFIGFIPVFLTGELAFLEFERLRTGADAVWCGRVACGTGVLVLLACMAVPGAEKDVVLRVVIGFGYALLVFGLLLAGVGAGRAGGVVRGLAGLGVISYPLYLIHAPVIVALEGYSQAIVAALPIGLGYAAGAALVVCVAGSLAVLLHVAVEQPSRMLGGRFRVGVGPRPAA